MSLGLERGSSAIFAEFYKDLRQRYLAAVDASARDSRLTPIDELRDYQQKLNESVTNAHALHKRISQAHSMSSFASPIGPFWNKRSMLGVLHNFNARLQDGWNLLMQMMVSTAERMRNFTMLLNNTLWQEKRNVDMNSFSKIGLEKVVASDENAPVHELVTNDSVELKINDDGIVFRVFEEKSESCAFNWFMKLKEAGLLMDKTTLIARSDPQTGYNLGGWKPNTKLHIYKLRTDEYDKAPIILEIGIQQASNKVAARLYSEAEGFNELREYPQDDAFLRSLGLGAQAFSSH